MMTDNKDRNEAYCKAISSLDSSCKDEYCDDFKEGWKAAEKYYLEKMRILAEAVQVLQAM